MNTHYILVLKENFNKEFEEVDEWIKEQNILLCKDIVRDTLVEYQLNKRGFTLHKEKATYPK